MEHSAEFDASIMPVFLHGKKVGVNLDPIDVEAGMRRLIALGWDAEKDARTFAVIQYALQRWARGEEAAAERLAIAHGETDPEFTAAAIDLTSWRIVLASAMAGATTVTPPGSPAAPEATA